MRRPPDRAKALYDRIVATVRALPGVANAAYSSNTPMSNSSWDTVLEPAGPAASPIQDRRILKNEVSPQWFSTYGIPIIAGRDFSALDQRSPHMVAIVNETLAGRYFDGDPIGRTVREVGGPDNPQPEVTLSESCGTPSTHRCVKTRLRRCTSFGTGFGPLSVWSGTESPAHLIHTVMAAIAGVDEDLSLRAHLLADDFSAAVARERMLAVLAALFGGLALLLAGIGLYGVVSYGVGVRRTDLASAWTWVQIGPAWSASSCGGLLLSCAWASLPESRPAS